MKLWFCWKGGEAKIHWESNQEGLRQLLPWCVTHHIVYPKASYHCFPILKLQLAVSLGQNAQRFRSSKRHLWRWSDVPHTSALDCSFHVSIQFCRTASHASSPLSSESSPTKLASHSSSEFREVAVSSWGRCRPFCSYLSRCFRLTHTKIAATWLASSSYL